MIPSLTDVERDLLRTFNLTVPQKRVVTRALEDAPNGTIEIAQECIRYGLELGNTGAGLLIHRIRRGDHFDAQLARMPREPRGPRPTGWRYVRGSHGETYVRDPQGVDVPPRNYA